MYLRPTEPAITPQGLRGRRHLLLSFLVIVLAACSNIEEPQPSHPEGVPPTTEPGVPHDPDGPRVPDVPDEPDQPGNPEEPSEPDEPNEPDEPAPEGPNGPNGGPELGVMLWQATMETGDQSEWRLDDGGGEYNSGSGDAFVSTQNARSGQHSLLMRIDTEKGGGGTRQFRWNELDNVDTITTMWAYLPHHIGLDRLNDWFNFIQWKTVKWAGKPGGSYAYNDPLWSLDIHERGGPGSGGDNFLKLVDFDDPNGVSAEDAPAGMNLPIGEWFKITTHFRRAVGDEGWIRVWLNDELMFDKRGIQTMRPDQSYTGWSVNAYADITYPNVTEVFIDDVAIHLPGDMPAVHAVTGSETGRANSQRF